MKIIIIIIAFALIWNLIILLLKPKSKTKHSSIFSAILGFLFSPKINLGSYSISNQKERSSNIEDHLGIEINANQMNQEEALNSYFIKPEYSVLYERAVKNTHSINIMGSIISLQINENESMIALKGMLDEAISCTSNLSQNEASSIISSSLPSCIITSNDVHTICHQIKSLAEKYRFESAKFENFIHR